MNIGIIGSGYVGLATALLCASRRHNVICSDINPERIADLNNGQSGFKEPDLDKMIRCYLNEKTLTFTVDNSSVIEKSDVIYICVQTDKNNRMTTDLFKDVFDQVSNKIRELNKFNVIVVQKSTVPVGFHKDLVIIDNIIYVSNPEFLREGYLIEDTFNPSRFVVGFNEKDQSKIDYVKQYFSGLYDSLQPIYVGLGSAELAKQACNAFLATKITFANIIQSVCKEFSINDEEVLNIMRSDWRIGCSFLNPGLGFGGSCFPKDLEGLIEAIDISSLVKEKMFFQNVFKYNKHIPQNYRNDIGNILFEHCNQESGGTYKLMVLGKTFKPDTNDVRNSPSIELIEILKRHSNFRVMAYDHAIDGELNIESFRDVDMIIIATDWDNFRHYDYFSIGQIVRNKIIYDCRNLFTPEDITKVTQFGFIYKKYAN